mmetsp:Transcript_27633/g.86423  ORF Transcript_27633/g.86423 Transcript_27633/m.86423 type:complete len:89 (-) Transcript_27633:97-363(-)
MPLPARRPPDCPCRVHRATSIAHAIPTRSPAHHRVTPTMHRQPSSRHAWKEVTMSSVLLVGSRNAFFSSVMQNDAPHPQYDRPFTSST